MNLPSTPMSAASGWRPVDPPRRPVLFVNPRSGGGKAARADLAERARERGVEAVVLVSNNPYALDNPLAPGTRPALDTGRFGIVVLDAPGEGRLPTGRSWTAPRLEMSAPAAVHAGVDGEAADLSPPLRFAIRPAALRVRISSRHPGASPSARLGLPGPPPPPCGSQDQLSDQSCDSLSILTNYFRKG